jgi:hypothetical protein
LFGWKRFRRRLDFLKLAHGSNLPRQTAGDNRAVC